MGSQVDVFVFIACLRAKQRVRRGRWQARESTRKSHSNNNRSGVDLNIEYFGVLVDEIIVFTFTVVDYLVRMAFSMAHSRQCEFRFVAF